jgi:hypothetical protein
MKEPIEIGLGRYLDNAVANKHVLGSYAVRREDLQFFTHYKHWIFAFMIQFKFLVMNI